MAAVMVLCGTCRASLFRPHYDHIVAGLAGAAQAGTESLSRWMLPRQHTGQGRPDLTGAGPTIIGDEMLVRIRCNAQ